MPAPLPLFPTTVVGSLPRPQYVKDLLAAGSRTGDHDLGWQRRMDDAVRFAIGMQEQAGIDIISDGEWRRETYVDVIAEIMNGFRWVKRDVFAYHQVVVERMTPRKPGVIAEEADFLRKNTDRHVKVALPSPYLIGQRMWVAEHSQAAYPTREAFCEALIEPLRQELLAIREAGVDVIQLDEPHLCVLVDPKIREQFPDPEAEMRHAVDWINQILPPLAPPSEGGEQRASPPSKGGEQRASPPSKGGEQRASPPSKGGDQGGVTLAVHLCRRNWGRRGWGAAGGYEVLLPHLRRLKAQQLMMEFSIPVAGDVAVLKQLPETMQIGLGCVDVRFPEIDPPERIVERLEKALAHVAPERLSLNPDCGFAPGKDHEVPWEEAYLKLKSLGAAGKILRGRHRQ